MRFYTINIPKYAAYWMGRLYYRLGHYKWIMMLFEPIRLMWEDYDAWRRERLYLINVSSQVISLEGYLNDQFDLLLRRIYITNAFEAGDGLFVALESEELPFVYAPLEGEATGLEAPLVGLEADNIGLDYSFIVHLPATLEPQRTQIEYAVNSYRLAGKLFKIKYF